MPRTISYKVYLIENQCTHPNAPAGWLITSYACTPVFLETLVPVSVTPDVKPGVEPDASVLKYICTRFGQITKKGMCPHLYPDNCTCDCVFLPHVCQRIIMYVDKVVKNVQISIVRRTRYNNANTCSCASTPCAHSCRPIHKLSTSSPSWDSKLVHLSC